MHTPSLPALGWTLIQKKKVISPVHALWSSAWLRHEGLYFTALGNIDTTSPTASAGVDSMPECRQ